VSACAPAEPGLGALQDAISSGSCAVGADQIGSFLPSLPTQETVQVSVASDFSAEERAAISSALSEWNGWSERSVGRNFFDETSAALDADFIPAGTDDPCDFASPGANGDFAIVRVSDLSIWDDLSLTQSNPAATLRCRSGDQLTRQVMLVRPDLVRSEQWASVILHELGHVVGLDHSCNLSAGTDDYLSCTGLDADHPYRSAVMYPKLSLGSLTSGRGMEVKEALQENDRLRAGCLYGGQP
jgi:hypothetical protein